MSKYTTEFKLKIVKKYLSGKYGGYEAIAKEFKISDKSTVRSWVRKYKQHGKRGLSKNKIVYNGKFKLNVIEYMHKNHLSLSETCIHFNLGSSSVVSRWQHIYYEKGSQTFFEKRRGRKNMKSNINKIGPSKQTEKDLIKENYQLRMENEYLKKLQALVQKRIKPKSKKK